MLHHRPIPRHLIDPRVMIPAHVHGTRHRHAVALHGRQPAAPLGPPPQLAGVGEHHGGRAWVRGRALLRLERVEEAQHRTARDAAGPADHAVREHAERLRGLAEEEDHAAGGREVGGGEDWDVRFGGRGTDGEGDGGEVVFGGQAGVDFFDDGFCGVVSWDGWEVWGGGRVTVEGEAVALVPAVVFGQEVLEVVVRVVDGADLVDLVDEVACLGTG